MKSKFGVVTVTNKKQLAKGKYFTVQTVHERKKKTQKSSQIGKELREQQQQ